MRSIVPLLFTIAVLGPLAPLAIETVRGVADSRDMEWERLFSLFVNTVMLGAFVILLVIPLSIYLSICWFNLPARSKRLVDVLLGFALFIPLPFLASAFQAGFEKSGTLFLLLRSFGFAPDQLWQPWKSGLGVAAAIHALQLLPWAIFILTQSLRTLPAAILEEIALIGSVRATRWKLLLPLLTPAIRFAAAWCALITSTEIVVTDLTLVRTLAEEVYTQATLGVDLARESIRTLPFALLLAWYLKGAVARFPHWQPSNSSASRDPFEPNRRPLWLFGILFVLLFLFPIWELGVQFASRAQTRDSAHLMGMFGLVLRGYWASFLWSTANSLIAGLCCSGLALLLLNHALERKRFFLLVSFAAIFAICLPGPVLGFSAKEFFFWLCDLENALLGRDGPLQFALYDGPAAFPVIWVHVLKYLPLTLALQYSLVRGIPPGVLEAARLEGVSEAWRLRRLVWPQVQPAFWLGVLGTTLLSFGEVSAGKIVETPGSVPFSQELFNQMHYGVSTTVAAMSLMQIAGLCLVYGLGIGLAVKRL